jgi:hypothetical protein
MMKTRICHSLVVACLSVLVLAPLSSQGQVNINGGYEAGIFSGNISFAGGLAQDLNAGLKV